MELKAVPKDAEEENQSSIVEDFTKTEDIKFPIGREVKEFPSRLGMVNYCLCIVSAVLFLVDYAINIIVFQKYFQLHKRHNQFEVYFYIIVGITLMPPLVTALFEVVWYKEEKIKYGKALKWYQWIIRLILMVLLLGPAFRYLEIFENAHKTAKMESLNEKQKNVKTSLQMKEDADFLYMLEKFTESGFHIVLQMFIVKVEMAGDDREEIGFEEVLKIVMAIFMMPYSITIYIHCHYQADETANNMGCISAVIQFMWRFLIIIPQAICLSFFLDVYPSEFVITTVATFVFMAVWVFLEGTKFCRGRIWLECIFRFFVAFVYLFTFFNVSKEDTYYKAVFYHSFIFMERTLMMCFWCLGEDEGVWYLWPAMVAFLLLFAIGIALQLIYYGFLHPTKPKVSDINKNWLPIRPEAPELAGKISAALIGVIVIPSPPFPVSFSAIYTL